MLVTLISGLILLFVAGAMLLFALLMSRQTRLDIERRLSLVLTGFKPLATRANATSKPAGFRMMAQHVRDVFSLGTAHRWGMRSDARKLLLLGSVAGLGTWLIAASALRLPNWIAASAAAFAFMLLPRFVLTREQSRAEAQFTNYFPDAIDMGVRMLRAGLPISAAIRSIGNEAAPPVNTVFTAVADQVEIGIPFEEALVTAGHQLGLPDFRFFAVAVALQRATGGNLAATLEILSDIMRKRRAVRLKAMATTAEVRVSANILGSLPFLVTGALLLVQPGYLEPLVTDSRGKFIVGAALISLLLAFVTMRRMMRSAVRL